MGGEWQRGKRPRDEEEPSQYKSGAEGSTQGGGAGGGGVVPDYTHLQLKPDHEQRPMWVCPNGLIILETYSPLYKHAYDFLIAVAEPVCRPENVHEYVLSPLSLYAAVSIGLDTETIISVLGRLSKTQLAAEVVAFIRQATQNYGKIKLVLQKNRYFVESQFPEVLQELLRDDTVRRARILGPEATGVGGFLSRKVGVSGAAEGAVAEEIRALPVDGAEENADVGASAEETETYSFEIDPTQVQHVKQRCLPTALNYPMLEEYDFKNDTSNPDLGAEMKPIAKLRPYQEKSLSKMFGNGRARSGIIVLPCGAGKSLVGVSAAIRVGKSCLCLATNAVSVTQWRYQFLTWSTIKEEQITKFTADNKEMFTTPAGVLVTTFNMIAQTTKRSEDSQKVMDKIRSREWGLLLMDEVHVVPAAMFRRVIEVTKSHCKLGLTATLVREDDKIDDLHFLIGPKLYEANWLDLVRGGFIANVQCVEVWCPMTKEFYAEYLKADAQKRRGLYWMNPNKFRACEYLIRFHEQERKDKIIVFSDDTFALEHYATKLKKPMIYGATSNAERERVIHAFRSSPHVNTIFLSRVGDTSIDIPEANVVIQISSQAGSRRQEAQRLGRILRAKGSMEDRMAGGREEYNAFYYSLVSTDTQEMYFSARRQQFLVNQGYSYKVVTSLPPPGEGQDLSYTKLSDQLDLLNQVLSASDNAFDLETRRDEGDEAMEPVQGVVRRTAGSLSGMSGGQGQRGYLEPRAAGRGGGAGRGSGFAGAGRGGGRAAKPKEQGHRHAIFKKLNK